MKSSSEVNLGRIEAGSSGPGPLRTVRPVRNF